MTAYAADDTTTSTATYTGQSFDVTVSWDNADTSSDYDSIKLVADAAVSNSSGAVAAGTALTKIDLGTTTDDVTSISVSGLTASTAGTITFTALGVDSSSDENTLGTTTVTITAAEIESVSDITGSVKYIPNYGAINLTYADMELTAKESFNYSSAADDLTWVVLDAEGNDATSSFSFTDAEGTSGLATTATSFSESVTISAANLTNSSDAIDAGTYTVKVYPSNDTSTYKTYDFTVVDTTSIGTYSVTDENDGTSDTLSIGDTRQLTAYYNNKKVSGITWSVPTSTTAVTVGESSGLVTAVEATSSIAVTATYELNDDMSIVLNPAYTVTVSADSYSVYIGDDTNTDILEIGDTTTATLMYGKTAVTSGITWTSSDESVATIDSSGNITAVAAGSATFTVKYKSDAGTFTTLTTETITVSPLSYVYTNADGDVVTTPNVVIGETYQLYLNRSDGKDITGTVTWKSSNKNVATVNSSGLVTVDSEATAAATATITAYIDGKTVGSSVTITAVEAVYTAKVVKSDGTSTTIDASTGTASLYYGETLNLTALYNGSEVDGEWAIDSNNTTGNINIKVTTAGVVSVIKTVTADDAGTTVVFNTEDSDGVISLTVTVKADAITMYQDDEEVTLGGTSPTLTYSIASMEQGETAKFTVKLGSTDITSDAVWKATDEDIVSVSGGVITAVAEGYGTAAPVTATYTLDSVTYKVTITVTKIIGSTGAIEASETAETEAATATEKATEATEAAETAQTAAAVAKADPTDANLKAATDALAEANSALSAAQSALKTAQAALAEADAAGAKSDGAVEAVEAAEAAVTAAKENVAAAEKAVETATAAVKEASTAVDEKKAADAAEKAAAEKAAAQATGATGTDSASGNAYKVTDGSSKTVAITKASSKASGKVTIPSTVTISGDKFTVTEISANAFKGNKKIKQVVIPKTVTKIGKNAFKNCSKVTKITIKATKNLTVGKNAFKGLKDGSKIVVKGVSGSAKKKLVKKIKKQVTSSRTTVK